MEPPTGTGPAAAQAADKEQTIAEMMRSPVLAHHMLFRHRHPAPTPAFHHEIVRLWHGSRPQVLIQAFRGAAKSTLAEEAILIQALLRSFHNAIILGETYERGRAAARHQARDREQRQDRADLWKSGRPGLEREQDRSQQRRNRAGVRARAVAARQQTP